MEDKILIGIKELKESEKFHREIAKEMFEAYGGAMYPLDILASSVLNRSLSLISGFCSMIQSNNFICAAPLIRLQLDNLLRFYAAFIVKDPHEFALKVINGMHIRKLKDQNGKLMTDRHLVNTLSSKFPWIEKVYTETSGYIHLSDKHILVMYNILCKF